MFTDAEKRIYKVIDGRHLDPLVVRRRLTLGAKGRLNDLILARAGDDDLAAAAAEETLAALARDAFAFPALDAADGSGASESDCLAELDRYLGWIEGNG